MLVAFRQKLAEHRGEVSGQVTVAQKLTADQTKQLKTTLKGVVGKDVALDVTVDPSLVGRHDCEGWLTPDRHINQNQTLFLEART